VVIGDGVSEVPGDSGGVDEVQTSEAKEMVWVVLQIS
jgi:hypothetical protein